MIKVFTIVGFAIIILAMLIVLLLLAAYTVKEFAPKKWQYGGLKRLAKEEPKTFMRFIYYLKRKYNIDHLSIEEI